MHLSLEVLHFPLPKTTALKGMVELPPPVAGLLRGREKPSSSSAADSIPTWASASPLGENVWHGRDSERSGSRNANLFVCLFV